MDVVFFIDGDYIIPVSGIYLFLCINFNVFIDLFL